MTRSSLRMLLTGLAAGGSLGATSEFASRARVPEIHHAGRDRGRPFRPVGGNGWAAGQPTDDTDMAMCIVHSWLELGRFDGADVARRLVARMQSGPADIGGTRRRTPARIADGAPWHEGG